MVIGVLAAPAVAFAGIVGGSGYTGALLTEQCSPSSGGRGSEPAPTASEGRATLRFARDLAQGGLREARSRLHRHHLETHSHV